MLTAEKVAERTQYIGGSDAAAVLGLSPWKTPLAVWAEKTGKLPPEDISDRLAVKLGDRLEQVVAQLFEEETGKRVVRKNATIFHKDYPFLAANIDRRVVGEDAILEVKTASGWMAKAWEGEEIPLSYLMQVYHYLAVTGAQYAYIAVLIGGNQQFVWKRIDRDEAAIKAIVAKEVHFWQSFVATGIQPDASFITYRDGATLADLYPADKGAEVIQMSDEANRIVESIRSMEEDVKAVEKQIDADKNRLKAFLCSAEVGTTGKYRVTWKEQTRESIDAKKMKAEQPDMAAKYLKTTTTRVLRIADEKQEESNG